jgi:hypothetical protein
MITARTWLVLFAGLVLLVLWNWRSDPAATMHEVERLVERAPEPVVTVQANPPAAPEPVFSAASRPWLARQTLESYAAWARYPPDCRPLWEQPGHERADEYEAPDPPARFIHQFSERLEDGSLVVRVGVLVHRPGSYEIVARVVDASGRGFAYLEVRPELASGVQEVRMRIFGKLIRDEGAETPFRLRDLEGLRRSDDHAPEPMVPLRGTVYLTRIHPEGAFSEREWDSEEKRRHLERFTAALGEN